MLSGSPRLSHVLSSILHYYYVVIVVDVVVVIVVCLAYNVIFAMAIADASSTTTSPHCPKRYRSQ